MLVFEGFVCFGLSPQPGLYLQRCPGDNGLSPKLMAEVGGSPSSKMVFMLVSGFDYQFFFTCFQRSWGHYRNFEFNQSVCFESDSVLSL